MECLPVKKNKTNDYLGGSSLSSTFAALNMQPIEFLYPFITNPSAVLITMHQKPDADAMGSSLALQHVLTQLGHQVSVVSPTNWASFLSWMPGSTEVFDFEAKREKAEVAIENADFIFCLDFNTLSRTKKMAESLIAAKGIKVLIDHHQLPAVEHFGFGICDTNKSSTSELVFDWIITAGWDSFLTKEVAACLYAGVMTDTGSFRFGSTSANVHKMVNRLMQTGFDHVAVHEALFDNFLENRLRFFGFALLNRMEVNYELNTAVIAISKADLLKFDIKTGDIEGLVNYPLSIQGIKLAAIVIDRDEERKWSFRSKGSIDVNAFSRKYFEGGGHNNAAGGRSLSTLESTVAHFWNVLQELQEALT